MQILMKYQVRVEFNLTNLINIIKTAKVNELETVKNILIKCDIHNVLYQNHLTNFLLI